MLASTTATATAGTETAPSIISTTELAQRLSSSRPPVVAEILGPEYFAKGHLPGAINLPLSGFAEQAQRALPDKSAEIVVYCASETCANSDAAQRMLEQLGYKNVRLYRAGKAGWVQAGHALTASRDGTCV